MSPTEIEQNENELIGEEGDVYCLVCHELIFSEENVGDDDNVMCGGCQNLGYRLYATLASFMQENGYSLETSEAPETLRTENEQRYFDERMMEKATLLFGQLIREERERNYIYTLDD